LKKVWGKKVHKLQKWKLNNLVSVGRDLALPISHTHSRILKILESQVNYV